VRELLVLSRADLEGLVSPDEAIESQRLAFTSLATGAAVLGPRVLVPGPGGSTGFSYVARSDLERDLVAKVGQVSPDNARRRLPTVGALVIALDAQTGQPTAVLDGETVTNVRTVAASAVAAAALRPQPRTLAVVGLGAQGRLHAEVLSRVLRPARTLLYDDQRRGTPSVTGPSSHADSVRDAVQHADIVVTCTTSFEPVLCREWLADDALVLSIGSFAPDRCEVGPDVVNAAAVVVDDVATALGQAGPVRAAVATGELVAENVTSLGDVLIGRRQPDPGRLTYYNSVGLGIQDAAVVPLFVAAAARAGVGVRIPW
jgi:ornithine cyclodeaminase